jgi:integrase
VPLSGAAQEALARHRAAQAEDRELFRTDYSDHDLVFCLPDGTPFRPGSITNAIEAHVKDCGLPLVRLHDTRHGACSLLLAGGVPIEVVQKILGHSSPEITRKVYAHLLRKVAAGQVETAAELLTKHRRSSNAAVSNP